MMALPLPVLGDTSLPCLSSISRFLRKGCNLLSLNMWPVVLWQNTDFFLVTGIGSDRWSFQEIKTHSEISLHLSAQDTWVDNGPMVLWEDPDHCQTRLLLPYLIKVVEGSMQIGQHPCGGFIGNFNGIFQESLRDDVFTWCRCRFGTHENSVISVASLAELFKEFLQGS